MNLPLFYAVGNVLKLRETESRPFPASRSRKGLRILKRNDKMIAVS